MEQGDPLRPKLESENLKGRIMPLRDALSTIRTRTMDLYKENGNVVIIVEGAWGTGKTTMVRCLVGGIGDIPKSRITTVDPDEEARNAYRPGGDRHKEYTYERARKLAAGRNLITALFPEADTPDILIVEAESAARVLINQIGIDTRNVLRLNLCPDHKTRWNNLYRKGKGQENLLKTIINTIRESPTSVKPEADINIDNSLANRLAPEEVDHILKGAGTVTP